MDELSIKKLVEKYETPMYVFDVPKLRERVKFLRNHLPDNVTLCYAVKANAFIIKELDDIIPRFEVCSPGELEICKNLSVDYSKIIFSGVYKTPVVIEELMKARANMGIYSIESMTQYKLLVEESSKENLPIKVMPRLTSGNQFGMTEEEIIQIINDVKKNDLVTICGIQYFSGTQKTSIKKLRRELTYVKEFITTLKEEYNFYPEELEFGPGLPVSYFQGDDFDEKAFLKEFSELLVETDFKEKLVFELGRSIAASCGTYLTKVVDMKSNKGQNYAIVDGGMNHIVYYGQSMAMKHPIYSVYPPRETGEEVNWNICGSLCTVNDILVKQLPIKDLKQGDVIVFENTGAYCMIEGISLFLSRDLPQVLLKSAQGSYKAVRDMVPTYPLNTPNY